MPCSGKEVAGCLLVHHAQRNSLTYLVLVLIMLVSHTAGYAQTGQDFSREDVRAALILRFFGYIEWPNEEPTDAFDLGLVGDDEPLFEKIQALSGSHRERGRGFQVTRTGATEELSRFDMVFVAKGAKEELDTIARRTRRSGTLIISDNETDKHNIMINLKDTARGTISFEINKSNIVYERLKMSPDILLLGGTELDIAELFKEKENELVLLRQTIERDRLELDVLRSLANKEADKLAELEGLFSRQRDVIEGQTAELVGLNAQMVQKTKEIGERESDLLSLKGELNTASDLLRSNESLLEERLTTIASKETEATELESLINGNLAHLQRQEAEIAAQSKSLAQQGSRIQQQQVLIVGFILGILVISGLLNRVWTLSRSTKKMNLELIDATDELESRVEERTRELFVAKEVAVEAEKVAVNANLAKSTFLANMSHEIRTPMNGVVGLVSLLLESELTDAQRNRLELVGVSASSLMSILNNILDLSKIEAGSFHVEETEFSVEELVDSCASLWRDKAQSAGLSLRTETSSVNGARAVGDEGQIKQILSNLISNSIKFTQEGHISLSVAVEDHAKGSGLRFTIEDTGIGILEDRLERIFDAFTQADDTLTREFGGTGLGLTISRQLAHMMNGDIHVASTPGEGSTFTFVFPCQLQWEESQSADSDKKTVKSANRI